MRLRPILLALALFVALPAVAADETSDTLTLTLPIGDAGEGRAAFLELSCPSCHRVSGEHEFPKPVSANRGPTLGGFLARRPPSQVAMSILDPSHEIDAVIRTGRDDGLSPMGNFRESMTVQQFLDIVAFLRSLPETPPAE